MVDEVEYVENSLEEDVGEEEGVVRAQLERSCWGAADEGGSGRY